MADWTLQNVAQIVGDCAWVEPGAEDLRVSGASIYLPTYRPGDIVFVRPESAGFGIPSGALTRNNIKPRLAIIQGDAPSNLNAGAILKVTDQTEALFSLAREARRMVKSPVIAITGSVGKTSTTAMTQHTLSAIGPVYGTREGANVPRGVAWNLACASPKDQFVVLELAIGGMLKNTALAKPDIAVFTNIHLAHLMYHSDLSTIAQRKARIFEGMAAGKCVVLNSDMNERAFLEKTARDRGLEILYYGRRAEDHVRLLSLDTSKAIAEIAIGDHILRLENCLQHGLHMLENFLAICAVHLALGVTMENLADKFADFDVARGRGSVHQVPTQGGHFTLLDHSYNANPASMRASLVHLQSLPAQGRRIAVLGNMAELGDMAVSEHDSLIEHVKSLGLDHVYTLGEGFDQVSGLANHTHLDGPQDLLTVLRNETRAGDAVLVKGSNSTGLYQMVKRFLNTP